MPSSEQDQKFRDLLAVLQGLAAVKDSDQILQRLTVAATDLTDSEAASILKYDEATNSLRFIAAPWFHKEPLQQINVPVENSIAGWVFRNVEPLIIHDVEKDPRHYKTVDQATKFTTVSLSAVPMIYQEHTLGVLEALNKANNAYYTEVDVIILEVLALYAAMVLWNDNVDARMRKSRVESSELDQLKSNFVAITSHELRTPLGLILGHATFLREMIDQEFREPIDIIIRNATRLKEIVERLTDVDNYESGLARIRKNLISIPSIVNEVFFAFQDVAASKNITLRMEVDESQDLQVEAEAEKVKIALNNLVQNAITFTDPGGNVLVKMESVPGAVKVSVIDDGIGIPAKDLHNVFERFYQVESHLTRRHGGMGLGLSVAKAMIEIHGGRIWAESVDGEGSEFIFTLPLKQTPIEDSGEVLQP